MGVIPKGSPIVVPRRSRTVVKTKREILASAKKAGGVPHQGGSDNSKKQKVHNLHRVVTLTPCSFHVDDASEISSKSGTPSPLVPRVGMGSIYPPGQTRSTSDLLRDFREPSVCSRASSGADTAENDEKDCGNEKIGSQLIKAGSLSSLGTR